MKHFALSVAVLLSACATSFQGEAKVPGGPQGCVAICQGWGMDLVGMFAAGEYSDGCICQVRGAPPGSALRGASSTVPAVAGVVMQMRRQQSRNSAGHI